jgi:hypothetical protein
MMKAAVYMYNYGIWEEFGYGETRYCDKAAIAPKCDSIYYYSIYSILNATKIFTSSAQVLSI